MTHSEAMNFILDNFEVRDKQLLFEKNVFLIVDFKITSDNNENFTPQAVLKYKSERVIYFNLPLEDALKLIID